MIEPPCWYTGDHDFADNGVCTGCGKQLRCGCGRFVRLDQITAHIDSGSCPLKWEDLEG